jgi:uncharacterized protein
MIPIRELKEKARELGVPPSTIERDYAQNWLLAHLDAFEMALKGGTGIKKVFIEEYRFSDDLDFTLVENYGKDEIQAALAGALAESRDESGIQYRDTVDINETRSGFRANVYFNIIQSSSSNPIGIHIDITDKNNEEILLPLLELPIFHNYSDKLETKVTSYSLEEIMGEKIRSVFQRTRPRDLYDIRYITPRVNRDAVGSILQRKCELKGIGLNIQALQEKRSNFSAGWITSLRHQVRDIPDFNESFEMMISEIDYYYKTFILQE